MENDALKKCFFKLVLANIVPVFNINPTTITHALIHHENKSGARVETNLIQAMDSGLSKVCYVHNLVSSKRRYNGRENYNFL